MGSIKLSPKHGVNPCIPVCFLCGKPKGELVLLGRLPGDAEAPRNACLDREPCGACKLLMQAGVILISVRDDASGDNPYRTGGWVVVRDSVIHDVVRPPELRDEILKTRVAFLPDEVWQALGLPTSGDAAPNPEERP